jgi:hypothetical protein
MTKHVATLLPAHHRPPVSTLPPPPPHLNHHSHSINTHHHHSYAHAHLPMPASASKWLQTAFFRCNMGPNDVAIVWALGKFSFVLFLFFLNNSLIVFVLFLGYKLLPTTGADAKRHDTTTLAPAPHDNNNVSRGRQQGGGTTEDGRDGE